jgi:hypothetical protein
VAGVVGLAILTGCGGDDPNEVVRDTQANLGDIQSGLLSLRAEIIPTGQTAKGAVGVRLAGPFSFRSHQRLPVARIRYTQLAGSRRASATLVSTGRRAYVEAEGQVQRLSAAQERELARAVGGGSGSRGLGGLGLDLANWTEDPKLGEGPSGGTPTDRVTARVDAAAAIKDVLHAAGAGGKLDDSAVAGIKRAVRRSSLELLTTKDDHLLRRLRLSLGFRTPPQLAGLVGGIDGGRLLFVLAIARPNMRVSVKPPPGAASSP